MNNLSCLPWYERLEDQNARRWWVPGVYPLYSRPDSIIPSFIRRAKRDGYNTVSRVYLGEFAPNTGIDVEGYTLSGQPEGVNCWRFYGDEFLVAGTRLLVRNPGASATGVTWTIYDELEGEPILFGSAPVIQLPVDLDGAISLYVTWDAHLSQLWELSEHESPLLPFVTELYTPGGELVADLWNAGLWTVQRYGEFDYLFPTAELTDDMPIGQYYIRVSDGMGEWFSDIFTVVPLEQLPMFLLIEWWNNADLQTDEGSILPGFETMAFKNRLFLKAEIAKPDYTYDEEGETRDGHFFPSKQISQKVYRFAILAPEYLLDAMRLLPLADHIQITAEPGSDREVVYLPEQILLTPSWESEGDVASVAVEFRTDTVVKKLGLAYIR